MVHPSLSSSLFHSPPSCFQCPPSLRCLSFSYIKDILTSRDCCGSSSICYSCNLFRAVGEVCNVHISSHHVTAGFNREHFCKDVSSLCSVSCDDAFILFLQYLFLLHSFCSFALSLISSIAVSVVLISFLHFVLHL